MLPLQLAMLAGLAADAPPATPTLSSPAAELITVTLAGVAAIITAVGGYAGIRRRRQADADSAVPVAVSDPEDRSSRIRERLTALETRANGVDRELADLREQLTLRRAADIVYEAEAAPRRRRRSAEGTTARD